MSKSGKEEHTKQYKTHGFRLSIIDVLFLCIGCIGSYFAWDRIGAFTYYIPFVILHFFLFCNVFRVRRNYELIWAGLFLLNNACWLLSGNLNIYAVFAVQIPCTVLFIILEILSDRYHGVFSKNTNEDGTTKSQT